MEYQELVRDFAERTRENLLLVRNSTHSGGPGFEVTQLVNSMLGLLVLPQQRYFDRIPAITIDKLRELGWPEAVLQADIGSVKDLQVLCRYLRNGIAHFNIEFTATAGTLDGLVIWNYPGGDSQSHRNWQVSLSIDDLREVADRFVDLMLGSKDQ